MMYASQCKSQDVWLIKLYAEGERKKMSLDKAILHGKERRKPYYGSGRYDPGCRPHGGCAYCYRNRMHKHLVRIAECDDQVKECFGGMMIEKTCDNCKYKNRYLLENPCIECLGTGYGNWQPAESETCEWTYQSYDVYYDTQCGETFQFTVGELSDAEGFKFCPYCGKPIKEVKEKAEEDE